MIDKNTQEIVDSLAMPVFYIPVYKTPEGKYFLDSNQVLPKITSPVKARKFSTFVFLAQLTTLVTDASPIINKETCCLDCEALVGCEQARGGVGPCDAHVKD